MGRLKIASFRVSLTTNTPKTMPLTPLETQLRDALTQAENLLANITQLSQPNHSVQIGELVRCADYAAKQCRSALLACTAAESAPVAEGSKWQVLAPDAAHRSIHKLYSVVTWNEDRQEPDSVVCNSCTLEDAKLIASCPELLKLVEWMLYMRQNGHGPAGWDAAALDAINKVKGPQ